jgi:hypothetical protein
MKSSLTIGAFLLVFLMAGCAAAPAAVPGPAGPQGATGDPGAAGRDRDRDRDADRDRERERERQDQHAACPDGQHERTDNGRTVCVRD